MNRSVIIESAALYWPIILSIALYQIQRASVPKEDLRRALVAGMMASVWVAATLPWLNELCVNAGYWSFTVEHHYTLKALPLSLYVGWIVLWGMLPVFLMYYTGFRIWPIVCVYVLLDLLTMGLFEPVMNLTPWRWLIGEACLVLLCLFPAVYLAKWVALQKQLAWRASLISMAFVMLLLWIIPSSVPAMSIDFISEWDEYPLLMKYLWCMLLVLASIPGINGVMEFVRVGQGTPIPYDAPRKLVTTGAYAYVQNPMQLSMVTVLAIWACIFSSWFVLSLSVVAIIYSIGIAQWSEAGDLEQRYGEPWIKYQHSISAWKMRLTPLWLHDTHARIYIDTECRVCYPIGDWLNAKNLKSLKVYPASKWSESGSEKQEQPLEMMIYYDPNNGEVISGVSAMARMLGHINLALAILGWVLMLPGVCWCIQSAMNASGGIVPQKRS